MQFRRRFSPLLTEAGRRSDVALPRLSRYVLEGVNHPASPSPVAPGNDLLAELLPP